jgi:splicing factor 3A subunit 1
MEKVLRGEVDEEVAPAKDGTPANESERPVVEDYGTEPPPPEFILGIHNVTPLDLCVLFLFVCGS